MQRQWHGGSKYFRFAEHADTDTALRLLFSGLNVQLESATECMLIRSTRSCQLELHWPGR